MTGVMVSVTNGVMNSIIEKLTTLLSGEFKLVPGVKHGIRFMRDELSSMNAALQRMANINDDQINMQAKEWRSKVRELSYDIEECIDRFIYLRSTEKAKVSFVQNMVRKIKELWGDRQIVKEIQELKALVVEQKERRDRYNIDQYLTMTPPAILDPRAPTMYEDAKDLVGIDGPRDQIIGWLKGDERQLKVVSIFGLGGQGKTTLAMEVYHKIEEPFDCRASVTISRTLDIKKLLMDLLFQLKKNEYERSERWDKEQLIPTLREQLMDKRYLIVIDDIWTISAWDYVKSALPANENRSRIITTTRIRDVAKSCCTSIDGHMYEAKPLSEDDSRTLFFRRIFYSDEDCPIALRQVTDDILRKCGGLPLAIISIAGLLANRSQTVEAWVNILNSISTRVEKDSPIDRMKAIFSLSYYDLPHYLKTCLLYLSVFPEDYAINTRHLIWRWIAEGLIPGHKTESMEQMGENYLNELINRSMVQPTKIGADGKTVKICRVHDVIHEFIVSKALEDNFVTIWSGEDCSGNYSNKIRGLSFRTDTSGTEMAKAMKNLSHLRSVSIFGPYVEHNKYALEFLNGQVLRVLNVPGYCYPQGCHVGHIESFTQLKHLRITGYSNFRLPEAIGKLKHLETLDVMGAENLPASMVRLQKLVRLFVPGRCVLPDGIGNLQALEELSLLDPCRASSKTIQAITGLTKLRALTLSFSGYDVVGPEKVCISSLSKMLVSLQTHCIWDRLSQFTLALMASESDFILASMASRSWTPPLRRLVLHTALPSVPSGISSLVNLARLKFTVRGEVSKEGLNILANLPMLLSLTACLEDDLKIYPRHVIRRQGFQRLIKFNFGGWHEAALKFELGAMPKLQRLKLGLMARCQLKYGPGGLVLGLHNLASLKHITMDIACQVAIAEEVEHLENDIRAATDSHPNNLVLEVRNQLQEFMGQGCSRRPSDGQY